MKGLNYRSPVGDKPGTFAPWVRALRNQSGAYVIRSKQTGEILYVGESHSGLLYDTLTRHFRPWDSKYGFFYSRHSVEVALRLTPPPSAVGAQDNLIRRLRPRDNTLGYEPDPF